MASASAWAVCRMPGFGVMVVRWSARSATSWGVFVGVGEDGYSAVSVFDVGGVPVGVGQSDAGGVSCGVDDGAHWFSRFS